MCVFSDCVYGLSSFYFLLLQLPEDEVKILMKELDPDDSGLIFYGVFSRTLRAQRAVIKLLDKAAREVREAEERGEVVPADAPMLKAGLLSGAWEASSRREARADARADGKSKKKSMKEEGKSAKNRKSRQVDSEDDDESADTSSSSVSSSSSDSDSEEHFFRRARREKKKKKKVKKKEKKRKEKKKQLEKEQQQKQQMQQQQMAADMAVARMAGSIYAPMSHMPPNPYQEQQQQQHPYHPHQNPYQQPPYNPQYPYQPQYQNHPPNQQQRDPYGGDPEEDDQFWSGFANPSAEEGGAASSPPGQRASPSPEQQAQPPLKPQPSADFAAEKFFLDPTIPRGLKKLWRQVEAYIDKRHGLDGAKLVQMFREFDANGNGVLSAEELRAQLARVGLRFNDDDFDMFLAEVDTNQDGMIEYSEFQEAVLGHHHVKMPSTGQRAVRALT